MEEKQGLREVLQELKQSHQQQVRFTKWQSIFSCVAALCCVGVLVYIGALLPRITDLVRQVETTFIHLEAIAEQLAAADLEGMVENMDSLVLTSQSSLEQISEKLSLIHFETLNRAIENLADVVEPLANFFHIFN